MYRRKLIITPILIGLNIAIFFLMEIVGSTNDTRFMLEHGASYWPYIYYEKEYYRLLTSSFLHFGIDHLISNMLVLGVLGEQVEQAIGRIKYLLIYLLAAVGSGFISYQWDRYFEHNSVSAGASGAVFGIAGAMLLIAIADRNRLNQLGMGRIGLFIIFSLYSGFRQTSVNNVAHVSGLIIGFFAALVLFRRPKHKKRKKKKKDAYDSWID